MISPQLLCFIDVETNLVKIFLVTAIMISDILNRSIKPLNSECKKLILLTVILFFYYEL